MRRLLPLLAAVSLATTTIAWARDWTWQDHRGNRMLIKLPAWPQNAKLRQAFRTAFVPNPAPIKVEGESFLYEAGVRVTLDNDRVYSAVERGLNTYHDARGRMLGAHPEKILKLLNWDRRSNQKLTLGALVDKQQSEGVLQLIRRHSDAPDAFTSLESIGFYITPRDVVFCLPDAPFAIASVESRVSWAELAPFAAPHSPLR